MVAKPVVVAAVINLGQSCVKKHTGARYHYSLFIARQSAIKEFKQIVLTLGRKDTTCINISFLVRSY
jgi:hypothetical protein